MLKEEFIKAGTDYLSRGFSIIPVIGKKSCIDWLKYQKERITIEEFSAMFDKYHPTGIAIITGKISNLTVIDIDSKEAAIIHCLSRTPIVETPRGYHFYYRYQSDVPTSAKIIENVDIRSDGGYIVAPPSLHPSGTNYKWLHDLNTRFEDFPSDELKERIEQNKPNNWSKLAGEIKEGERHNQICKIIGTNIHYFPEHRWKNTVWPMIQAINNSFKPPLEYGELRDTFDSLTKKKQQQGQRNIKQPKEIKILSIRELFETTDEKATFIIDRLIPKGINVISGHPGSCKSWVMLNMVKAIVSGGKLFDKYETIKGNVMIVDGECGAEELKRRMKMLNISEELPIHIIPRQNIKIDDKATLDYLLEEAARLEIKVVIFDPLSSLHTKIENSSDDMQKVLDCLEKFQDLGITVIAIHHLRKDSGQNQIGSQNMRGSSVVWGRIDSNLMVSNKDKTKGALLIIQVNQEKLRTGEQEKSFELHMNFSENEVDIKYAGEIEPEEADKGKLQSAIELIPELLQKEGKTRQEIQSILKAELDVEGRTVHSAIQTLLEKCIIKQSRKGKERFYELMEVSQNEGTFASV